MMLPTEKVGGMSRTFKDRPYWVRANDPMELGRRIKHDHARAGNPIYEWRTVLDEAGEPILEEHESEVTAFWVLVFPSGSRMRVDTYRETWTYSNTVMRYQVMKTKKFYSYKEEQVLVGYRPSECTEEISLTNEPWMASKFTHLCTPEIGYGYRWSRNRPRKAEKQAYHASARTQEKEALRAALRASQDDLNDMWGDEFEKARTRQQRHNGRWD